MMTSAAMSMTGPLSSSSAVSPNRKKTKRRLFMPPRYAVNRLISMPENR